MFVVASAVPHGNDYFRSQCLSLFSSCVLIRVFLVYWQLVFFYFFLIFCFMFSLFFLSLWSFCECDVISYVLILFRFGSGVLVLARVVLFNHNFFPFFLFLRYISLGEGFFYHLFMSFLRVYGSKPCFFLIFGWGYYPERFQAILYSLFRTLLASLPLLIGISFHYGVLHCYNELLQNELFPTW